jgi:outer membrane immunogenic protein
MKRILFGSIALIALGMSAPAMAADMPVKAKAPPPVVWDWSGVYLGAHAGGAWARTNWDSDFNCAVGVFCDSISQKPSGWLVGAQYGARWQWGAWVVGLEGTYSAARIRADDPSTCTPGVNTCIGIPGGFDVHHETTIQTLITGTAQLGYTWDRTLWYVKGGWAGGEIRRKSADVLGAPAATFFGGDTRNASGWTVGTGLEYMALKTSMGYVSFGIEYDYYRLKASGFRNNAISGTGALAFVTNASDITADVHQVVLRANVAVDWCTLSIWSCSAPVTAKY